VEPINEVRITESSSRP